jgi:hypothetical protein
LFGSRAMSRALARHGHGSAGCEHSGVCGANDDGGRRAPFGPGAYGIDPGTPIL